MDDLANRFLTAWKQLEQHLDSRWFHAKGGPVPDGVSLLRWAERSRQISPHTASFLHACRKARNAYAHVAFDNYVGPITLPPEGVVYRLERVLAEMRSPSHVKARANSAVRCKLETTVQEALLLMRRGDFSQLPYWHPDMGWLLVTREQIACWLEVSAEIDGQVLLDLREPVAALADNPAVGPVVPRLVRPSDPLTEALDALEATMELPDNEPGGYPAVLVANAETEGPVRIITVDDMPDLYQAMGR